eukprot:1045170-Ditylum_brightwellii.AAC.1
MSLKQLSDFKEVCMVGLLGICKRTRCTHKHRIATDREAITMVQLLDKAIKTQKTPVTESRNGLHVASEPH